MRWIAALVLVACGTAPAPRASSKTSPREYLIESAAIDFHTHRPPEATGFRNVRFGHVPAADGGKRFILCGEFLPSGKTEWMPFSTIKTSQYEHFLGPAQCQTATITWEGTEDLAPALLRHFASLK
jgi:hypothetical protein